MSRNQPREPLPGFTGTARRKPSSLFIVRDLDRAACLIHPIKRRILAALVQRDSASGLARRLRIPRQLVWYHMQEMARERMVIPAGRRKRRQFVDQCYVARARTYLLSPELLGKLAADPKTAGDRFSASYLLGLASQVQTEVTQDLELAGEEGKRLATLSLNAELRFTSKEQRAKFTEELERAVVELAAQHSSPYKNADGSAGQGRAFRLVLGCYPIPGTKERGAAGAKDEKAGPSPETLRTREMA
ncbi:MAG TPA: helix-turn-helix domain-containing protein [Candidatus Acidoferrum sp.]|nr:helix-turn-helix domain-containing protein [Candidatus Acidoferrum sp.]